MKKVLLILSIIVLMVACKVWAVTASNGTTEWVYKSNGYNVLKVTIPFASATDDETVTWDFNGIAQRIVVDVNAVDADGDITIKDTSGANYVNLENKLGSGDVDYIIQSFDQNDNAYGGIPVAVTHTMQFVNCAAAAPIYVYIYYKK